MLIQKMDDSKFILLDYLLEFIHQLEKIYFSFKRLLLGGFNIWGDLLALMCGSVEVARVGFF